MAITNPQRTSTSCTNLASCIVATIFLIFSIIIILIIIFTVFKPQNPKISIKAVQLPAFSLSNNTVNFTFSQYVTVTNPNRDVFTHFDSSIQLDYSGNQVGFMFIPAGKIDSGRTQYMSAMFSVESFPLMGSPSSSTAKSINFNEGDDDNYGFQLQPTFEIESRMKMVGRVKILQFFTHNVESRTGCRVAISVHDGSVLGFHC